MTDTPDQQPPATAPRRKTRRSYRGGARVQRARGNHLARLAEAATVQNAA